MKATVSWLPALTIFLITLWTDNLHAASEAMVRLATPRIASLTEEDGSGVYQKLMQRALQSDAFVESQISVKQIFFPYKRALQVFLTDSSDCVYSFTKVAQRELGEESVVSSFPLGAFAYYIFTRKQDPVIRAKEGLKGLRVGGVVGHDTYYRHSIKGVNLHLVASDEQNIQLLKLQRIEAFIAAIPDILPYTRALAYDPTAPLVKSFDRITCHDSVLTRKFLSVLDPLLIQMKKTGVYRQVFGHLYVDFVDGGN